MKSNKVREGHKQAKSSQILNGGNGNDVNVHCQQTWAETGQHVCDLPLIETMNPIRFTLIVKSKNISNQSLKKERSEIVSNVNQEPILFFNLRNVQIIVFCSVYKASTISHIDLHYLLQCNIGLGTFENKSSSCYLRANCTTLLTLINVTPSPY